MPIYAEGSIRDLARKLDIDAPVSTQELIRQLADLAPAGYMRKSGDLVTGYVHAYSDLHLQSDGVVSFKGWAREEGAIGDNFLLTATLRDVKDAQGRALTFAHADTLAGKALPGHSSKNWTNVGYNQTIADQWEEARDSPVDWYLHISTDPWQVTEAVVGGLLIAAVGAIVIALLSNPECPKGQKPSWKVETVKKPRPEHPEDGSEVVYRYECR